MNPHPPTPNDRSAVSSGTNKRRRIDAVAAAHLYPTSPSAYQQQLPYSTPSHHVPVSVQSSYSDAAANHYVARQPHSSPLATSYSGTPHTQQGQWAPSHAFNHPPQQSYVHSYQDPRSVQHAYYYGQTDPSVYNSPWPPVQHDGHSNVHAPSIPATSQPQTMTYMQPAHQSPVDSQQSYDTATAPSYATTLQNFDVGSFGLGHDVHSQQHQQHQIRKSPSNLYFEDASMHLKMQSLPILNSLVSFALFFRARCGVCPCVFTASAYTKVCRDGQPHRHQHVYSVLGLPIRPPARACSSEIALFGDRSLTGTSRFLAY